MIQQTLVLLKPDAIERGFVGEIISIFEKANLKIFAMKMLQPTVEIVSNHYPAKNEWLLNVGKTTLGKCKEAGVDVYSIFLTEDELEVGRIVKNWLVEFLTSGRVIAIVIEGNEAIKKVRSICGATVPALAEPGTIRGRYSADSPDIATLQKRPLYNLVHASSSLEDAQLEIKLWFPEGVS